jgi:hypothetical protein
MCRTLMSCVHRCRAENLCHSLRHGIDDMWVATGTSAEDVTKLKDDDSFMHSNLRVMQAGTR